MSEQKQEEGGSVIPGTIGAAAGAFAGYKLASGHIAKKGIKGALESHDIAQSTSIKPDASFIAAEGSEAAKGAAKAKGTFNAKVGEIIEKTENAALKTEKAALDGLKTHINGGGQPVGSVVIASGPKKGLHTMQLVAPDKSTVLHQASFKKLPKGIAVGEIADPDKVKDFLASEGPAKKIATNLEKDLVKGIKKEGGHFFGFKNTTAGGKAAIIGSAVAATIVGALTLNAMFGGSKSKTNEASPKIDAASVAGTERVAQGPAKEAAPAM